MNTYHENFFLDTVGLVALWYEPDQWHEAATLAFNELLSSNVSFITTPYVLAECSNALARTNVRLLVCRLRSDLQRAATLITPTDDETNAAWEYFHDGSPGEPGIVDLLSFQIMRRENASEAFSNDRHFRTAGFTTLF